MSKSLRLMESRVLRNHRREAWEEQGRCCKYCFAPLEFKQTTADHKVPRSKGGMNLRENIICACAPCNMAKGSWNILSFTKAIKSPPPGAPIQIHLAAARRRIWLATHRACRRINYSVGLPNPTPIGQAA